MSVRRAPAPLGLVVRLALAGQDDAAHLLARVPRRLADVLLSDSVGVRLPDRYGQFLPKDLGSLLGIPESLRHLRK